MQSLVHYSDDSSPESSRDRNARQDGAEAGPSRLRTEPTLASPSSSTLSLGSSSKSKVSLKRAQSSALPLRQTAVSTPNAKPAKRPRRSSPSSNLPENLTHTAQSDVGKSELGPSSSSINKVESSAHGSQFNGMNQEQILRAVTRPEDIEGVEDWGIPPAVDPSEASDQIQAKVDNFLRLKYERGEHINTRLLASSAFANPHIYSKLVEFVSIDERATAFPSSGWLTRRNLEAQIPDYGPAALSSRQKAREEAVKASQAAGKRSEIKFAPPKYTEKDKERDERKRKERNGGGWDRDRKRHGDRDADRGGQRRDKR